jgi:hypothetical protein
MTFEVRAPYILFFLLALPNHQYKTFEDYYKVIINIKHKHSHYLILMPLFNH